MSGSNNSTTNTTSQSTNEIPQWVQNAGMQNYGLAQTVASQPLQQYQGQMVADVAPQTQQAWNLAANSGGVGQDSQNAAQAGYLNAMSQTPQQINPAQIANTNLAPYMNPYTSSVINSTLPIMQQNLGLSQDQQQNAANSANAYGGSRQGVQQGVTQAQGALGMGQMAAQLNQANFGQAQAAAGTDVASQNAAQLANQQAAQAATNSNILASSGLGNLGLQQQQNNVANFGMLSAAGGEEQQQSQNDINAQMAKFQQAFTYPQQQLGMMESSLGMTPYDTSTSGSSTSDTTQTQSNPASLALGGMGMLGSMFGSGGAGMSLLSSLGIGSDKRLKTDIKKVDTHKSGVPIYAFRYKGDPKSYPKVVGPMAEDVAKVAPHAVRPMGVKGRLAIHMPALDALGPGATPPSSPGLAVGLRSVGSSATPGRLSSSATPASSPNVARGLTALSPALRSYMPHGGKGALAGRSRHVNAPIRGALSG
jgi:hypothetical protein